MRTRSVSAALMLMLCAPAFAQWVPIVAEKRIVVESVDSNGRVTERAESKATFFRSSKGSTLEQRLSPQTGEPVTGILLDYSLSHRAYHLNYETREAVATANLPQQKGPPGLKSLDSSSVVGHETVSGIECVIQPITASFKGKDTVVGKAWVSPSLGFLIVREESLDDIPDGVLRHRVKELYNVKTKQEPDANLFDVPKSFSVRQGTVPPSPPSF